MNERLCQLELSGIRKYTNFARSVDDCVMLTLGEPEFHTPQAIQDAAIAALQQGQTHYAPNQGLLSLRQAIAACETKRGLPCKDANILVTAGATGALFTALLGILNPGDEVIVPIPAFPLYQSIITIAGAKLVALDISKTDFQIRDLPITDKTRAIVLNSPNNPTGCVLDETSLAIVKKAVLGKDIYLVCDNVYDALSSGNVPDLSTDPQLREQVLLCQSFSKPYAMTGWRVGYLVAPEALMERLLLLHAAQVAAIPTFLQTACITALETDIGEMAASYQTRRQYVCQRLTEMGLSYPEPKGAFYAFPSIEKTGLKDTDFCTRLIQQAGVATVPGSCFGTPGHIRLSYACPMDALKTGLDRLEIFIKKLG